MHTLQSIRRQVDALRRKFAFPMEPSQQPNHPTTQRIPHPQPTNPN